MTELKKYMYTVFVFKIFKFDYDRIFDMFLDLYFFPKYFITINTFHNWQKLFLK